MSGYELPTALCVAGEDREIRSDYRPALDVLQALGDVELSDEEKALVTLTILYEDANAIPRDAFGEALKAAFQYLAGGQTEQTGPTRRLMDWEQDLPLVLPPINRVLGTEVRAVPYCHWWTFLAAYQEIGDCLFAQVVRVRDKLHRGKALDKADREFYRHNRALVDFKTKHTDAEQRLLKEWM